MNMNRIGSDDPRFFQVMTVNTLLRAYADGGMTIAEIQHTMDVLSMDDDFRAEVRKGVERIDKNKATQKNS